MKATLNWHIKHGIVISALGTQPIKIYNKLQYAHPTLREFNAPWHTQSQASGLKCKTIYQLKSHSPSQRLFKLMHYLINSLTQYAPQIKCKGKIVIILLKPQSASDFILEKLLQRASISYHALFKEALLWSVCNSYPLLNFEINLYMNDPQVEHLFLLGLESFLTQQGQKFFNSPLTNEIILGEAAAWVHLEHRNQAPPNNQLCSFNSVKMDTHSKEYAQAICNLQQSLFVACTKAAWVMPQVKHNWRIAPLNDHANLSWYEATHNLWQRVPKATLFTPCLGELGHAALPLCLALAAHVPHSNLLISLSDNNAQHTTCCITGKNYDATQTY